MVHKVLKVLGCSATLCTWFACAEDPAPPRPSTVRIDPAAAQVARWQDRGTPSEDRVRAGLRLARLPGGIDTLSRLAKGMDSESLLLLLDTLLVVDPAGGSAIAAEMLDRALGEEKLDYAALLFSGGEGAAEPLLGLLRREASWETQVQALRVLGMLGLRRTAPDVTTRLSHTNSWVRIAAAHALGEIGGPQATPGLVAALGDSSDEVVSAALIGLGRAGDEAPLGPVMGLAIHRNPRVRGAVASALGRLGRKEGIPMLEKLLTDPDEGVRHKSRRALDRVRKASGSNTRP